MRAAVIGVVLLALPPEAVNFDSLPGFALIVAWAVACGVVALGVERLVARRGTRTGLGTRRPAQPSK